MSTFEHSGNLWFFESLHSRVSLCMSMDEVIHSESTGCHELILFKNEDFGRVLTLDGVVQLTEKDEFIYHEMIAHVPLMEHENPRRVLVIGGGDGGVLREVLKYNTVEKVFLVEIDRKVIDFSQKHLRSVCLDSYSDPRVEVVIEDGSKFVEKMQGFAFDVAIIDSTDPIGAGEVLFSSNFQANLKKCLDDKAIVVTQNGVIFSQFDQIIKTDKIFSSLYCDHGFYLADVPTYSMGAMTFGFASDFPDYRGSSQVELAKKYEYYGLNTSYYNPSLHLSSFALPSYALAKLSPCVRLGK